MAPISRGESSDQARHVILDRLIRQPQSVSDRRVSQSRLNASKDLFLSGTQGRGLRAGPAASLQDQGQPAKDVCPPDGGDVRVDAYDTVRIGPALADLKPAAVGHAQAVGTLSGRVGPAANTSISGRSSAHVGNHAERPNVRRVDIELY